MTDMQKKGWFACFAQGTATLAGSAGAFALAIGVVLVWAVSGPLFHFSEVWQLVINTGTTIVTFLMVFLVQNAQNRDGKVIQLKLDELIRAVETANTAYIGMDDMSEAELEALRTKYARLAERARHQTLDIPKSGKGA
ncbi:low affinity iron permease family protein [Asticcacaulis sp.]|uniref:low affinity iron permease family protein n=1 Tax=Asticcacaulis sp. TaxID=1872648 RepID=UPI002C2098D4|nr:low affinity iron permease family protein [Asticcacaulis sp.]HTM82877.1 low affinity iron permease family protein [Asticcacaulis sp.]